MRRSRSRAVRRPTTHAVLAALRTPAWPGGARAALRARHGAAAFSFRLARSRAGIIFRAARLAADPGRQPRVCAERGGQLARRRVVRAGSQRGAARRSETSVRVAKPVRLRVRRAQRAHAPHSPCRLCSGGEATSGGRPPRLSDDFEGGTPVKRLNGNGASAADWLENSTTPQVSPEQPRRTPCIAMRMPRRPGGRVRALSGSSDRRSCLPSATFREVLTRARLLLRSGRLPSARREPQRLRRRPAVAVAAAEAAPWSLRGLRQSTRLLCAARCRPGLRGRRGQPRPRAAPSRHAARAARVGRAAAQSWACARRDTRSTARLSSSRATAVSAAAAVAAAAVACSRCAAPRCRIAPPTLCWHALAAARQPRRRGFAAAATQRGLAAAREAGLRQRQGQRSSGIKSQNAHAKTPRILLISRRSLRRGVAAARCRSHAGCRA